MSVSSNPNVTYSCQSAEKLLRSSIKVIRGKYASLPSPMAPPRDGTATAGELIAHAIKYPDIDPARESKRIRSDLSKAHKDADQILRRAELHSNTLRSMLHYIQGNDDQLPPLEPNLTAAAKLCRRMVQQDPNRLKTVLDEGFARLTRADRRLESFSQKAYPSLKKTGLIHCADFEAQYYERCSRNCPGKGYAERAELLMRIKSRLQAKRRQEYDRRRRAEDALEDTNQWT